MIMLAFDTLNYAKRLKKAGFTEEQAEVQANGLAEIIEINLVKKQDIKNLEANLKQEIKALEAKTDQLNAKIDHTTEQLNAKIQGVEVLLSTKIANVDTKLNWLITLIGIIGFALTLLSYIRH